MSDGKSASPQELADHVVAVALGEKRDKLPAAEELMTKLDLGYPIATESVTSAVDPEDLDPESCAWHLKKHASPERCAEIAEGAELSPEEHLLVTKAATLDAEEGGTFDFVRYYRITDSKGRSVYFSDVSGDDLGSYGPSSCHRGPLLELPYAADTSTQLEDGTVIKFYITEWKP
jgi:hypothetical protein